MSQKYDVTIKIVVITDSVDYAMSFLDRFMFDRYEESLLMTIGMEHMVRYETINGVKVAYSIWMMSPEIRFKVMKPMVYKHSNYFLVLNKNGEVGEALIDEIRACQGSEEKIHIIVLSSNSKKLEFGLGTNLVIHQLPVNDEIIPQVFSMIGKNELGIEDINQTNFVRSDTSKIRKEEPFLNDETIYVIIRKIIEDRRCCKIHGRMGVKHCDICGRGKSVNVKSTLSIKNIKRSMVDRYCCKMHGLLGDQYCNVCGRTIDENWIINT